MSYNERLKLEIITMKSDFDFFEACQSGSVEDVLSLIPMIEHIDIRNDWSRTGLAIAVRNERFEIAKILVKAGANVNAKNRNGTTIFMYAKTPIFKSKNTETLRWLLNSGADINSYDNQQLTVLDYVKKKGDASLQSWMINNGAKFFYQL